MPVVLGIILFATAVWIVPNWGVLWERATLLVALIRSDDCVKLSDEHGFCGRELGFVQRTASESFFVNPISQQTVTTGDLEDQALCAELDDQFVSALQTSIRDWQAQTFSKDIIVRFHRELGADASVVVMRGRIKALTAGGRTAYQDVSFVANCTRRLHIVLTSRDNWPSLGTQFDDVYASVRWPETLNGALAQ